MNMYNQNNNESTKKIKIISYPVQGHYIYLTFLITMANAWHLQVEGAKLYFCSWFIEISGHSLLVSSQSYMTLGHNRGETVHSRARRKQGKEEQLCLLSISLHCIQTARLWGGSIDIQGGPSHYPSPQCAKPISGLI